MTRTHLSSAWPGSKQQPAQIKDFKDAIQALDCSIKRVCVCGNHDIGNTPTGQLMHTSQISSPHASLTAGFVADATIQNFRDAYATDDKLIFREGGVRFLTVNTQLFKDGSCAPLSRQNQLQFLREELAVCERTVAFGHIPPFITSYDEPSAYSPFREPE